MKMKQTLMSALVVANIFSFSAIAAEATEHVALKSAFTKLGFAVEAVAPAEMGLFEVTTNNGIFYANQDGSYFIYGQMFDNQGKQPRNLTESALAKKLKTAFDASGIEKEVITFPAKDEKYVINVFTDISCGYCVKLHNEVGQYNDLGITVRYIAFPRGGDRSPAFDKMASIWCSTDKNAAMDQAKGGKLEVSKDLTDACRDTVRKHLELGEKAGVNGTPAIMLEDGSMLSGYLPAARLLEVLNQKQDS